MRFLRNWPAKIAGMLFLGLCFAVLASFFLSRAPSTNHAPAPVPIPPISPSEHVYGSSTSTIVLIEYYDLECPYCKTLHEELPIDFLNSIGYVYRPFPLPHLHEGAARKALVALCAEEGGPEYLLKAMEYAYADLSQSAETLAASLGAIVPDASRFTDCIQQGIYRETISQHAAKARVGGVHGTPTVILFHNGMPIQVFQLVGPRFLVRMIEAFKHSVQ